MWREVGWRGVEVTRVRGRSSSTKLHPSRDIGRRRGPRVGVECTRMWRGREGSTIRICRRRLSTAPWRGVVAIVWPMWWGRLKDREEREGGRDRERERRGRERKRER